MNDTAVACQAVLIIAACRVGSPDMSDDRQSVREVVGENARRIRDSVGASQDDVATAAREVGLRWTRSRVAALERGDKSVDVAELVLLAQVLGEVSGKPVGVGDLLDGQGATVLSPAVTVHRSSLARWLGGEPVEVLVADVPGGLEQLQDILARAPEVLTRLARLAGADTKTRAVSDAVRAAGEAEERAGRTLGVSRADVAHLSAGLWGHALTTERDSRVGDAPPGSRAQLRGRVTRQLVAELRERLEEVGGA